MVLVSNYEGYLRLILVKAWDYHCTWTCYSSLKLIFIPLPSQLHMPLHLSLLVVGVGALGECGVEGASIDCSVEGAS